jgi:hypothetical protein
MLVPVLKGMPSSSRTVEVKPLGPVQLHDPLPVFGCGPRSTTVPEATVTELSRLQTPATEMYGTIGVGVQEVLSTVSAMVVDAVNVPEVPVIVTLAAPVVAELLAVSVSTLLPVVGSVPNAAVTPLGRPDAVRVTLPVNVPTSVTEIVSVALLPCATVNADDDAESVKLPPTVIVNTWVTLSPQLLV